MARNRKDRRADPDRWHRIVSYFDPEEAKVVQITPDPSGVVCIRGSIDNVIVVQVPDLPPHKQVEILKGVQATLEGAGINKPLVLLPAWAKLCKFETLDAAQSKKLDQHARDKRFSDVVENAASKMKH